MSYFPGIVHSYSACCWNNVPFTYNNGVAPNDFNGGFHLRAPIPRSHVIPYGVISGGLIHTHGYEVIAPAPFGSFNYSGGNQFAVSGGAGIRYYAAERLGFRAEFKAYKPTGGDAAKTGLNANTFLPSGLWILPPILKPAPAPSGLPLGFRPAFLSSTDNACDPPQIWGPCGLS